MTSPILPSSDSTSTEPIRYCRCCSEPCGVIVQTDYRKNATGPLVLSTCVEPSCALHLQTLSDNTDLSKFSVTALYDGLTGAALPKWVVCSNVGKDTPRSRWEAAAIAGRK